jgi:hypothetical protein
MKSVIISLFLLLSSVVLFHSCKKNDFPQNLETYKGTPVDLGNGQARAWITVSHLGAPVELGLELTRASLYDLPNTNFSVTIPLPQRAKELTPFDHIYITWAAQGHPLPGPTAPSFIGPHYDIRFFMTTLEEHLSIPPPTDPSAKFNIYPPEGYMPSNYFPDASVPGLGLHWTDKSGFTGIRKAMILGTYNGKFTFVSPIVIIEELQSGNSSSTPYTQPEHFQDSKTYYPTVYNIYADDSKEKHQVTLSDFVMR